MVNDWYEFNGFKQLLGVTDGNLASHLSTLERMKFIEVKKEFVGKKPKTSYRATLEGRNAFKAHLDALEEIIKHGNLDNK